MCTLIVAVRAFADVDLLVSANRDENLDRPASPPSVHPAGARGPRAVLAPLDEKAGGTWLGLNAAGLFCGITNRFGSAPPDPTRRSRGELVFRALAADDPAAAAERLARTDPLSTNRFHLIMADRQTAWAVIHDDQRVWAEELGPGLHILTERSWGAAPAGRSDWLRARVEPSLGGAAPSVEQFAAWLSFHHPDDPFAGTCVHFEAWRYGTRSQTQLRLGPSARAAGLWHTEGPPCQRAVEDQTHLLRALGL